MTTIILTIIGILLAAAAALMVIFYGGDAFNSASIGAEANTYQNAGTNLIAAAQLARANGVTINGSLLTNTLYLDQQPELPSFAEQIISTDTGVPIYSIFIESDNRQEVCNEINENLRNGVPSTATQRVANVKMQCVNGNFSAVL